MKKFKMFFDIEKEEQWLNEQLQKGYRCTNISGLGIYTFEETDKRYIIRLDYQDYLPKKKLVEYKGIYEDFGWNYIKGPWLSGIRYWQKKDDDQNEIFSDRQSKDNHYKKLMNYSFWLVMLCLAYSYMFYQGSGLYHEGLWSMKGSLFWKAFLFETPFVFLKLSSTLLFVFLGINFYKAYRKYSMLKEK
ncbi:MULTISPECIES: DUF2812 domain-containing protein [Bacillus cereus group]|uniref:DUF2812 domain-containing protein n=1 Tax=Bacillus cereus HuA2-1 TaxID=1053201 RepID=J9B679_BACCE|nr:MULTISPECIES: DUF2812 domain-containing protein [Bacillus cereus group]EJV74244.1 hypothetical protein IG3_05835 [Bacillus cereus HuA2-1]QWG81459.1 DUF2812 domain-containing protein [Bacillus mycoides]TXR81424.1 DUF2812 domain-containing protein [Bacillus sp. AR13-1]